MSRPFIATVAAGVLLAACAGATSEDAPETSTTVIASTTSTTVITVDEPVTATSLDATTTTDGTSGEPIAGPEPGLLWMVVGVSYDDVLNVRASAGTAAAIVDSLEPTEEAIVTGSAVLLDRSIWWEIERPDGGVGWVNATYLGTPGVTEDIAASVVAAEGGIPSAPDMAGLVDIVLPTAVGFPAETIVVAAATVNGDIGEMTMDVLSTEPDDSVRGLRLTVFGQRDGGTGPFGLKAVEVTSICWRGADAEGLCV